MKSRIVKRNRLYVLFLCVLILFCGLIVNYNRKMAEDTRGNFVSFSFCRNAENKSVKKAEEDMKLNAKYAVLMDGSNRRVLYEKNAYTKAAMASTTKIMTLLVTLENANLEDEVCVSSYAASMPKVHLGIKEGEVYRLKDLMYSLMLESHNDSAVAIAEHVGGSVEGFAKLMNDKAKEIGAFQTNFVTPNGLDHKQHYSTAYDMGLITCYALENREFLNIIQTMEYSFHEQTKGRVFHVQNKDLFLSSYPDAIGVKTGFTGNAGYCFVGAIKSKEHYLISVVLASSWPPRKNDKWKDTRKLMDYGKKHYSLKKVIDKQQSFSELKVEKGIEQSAITPYIDEEISLLLGDYEKITYDILMPDSLIAPVRKGQKVGRLVVYIDGKKYKEIAIYSNANIRQITFSYILKELIKQYVQK